MISTLITELLAIAFFVIFLANWVAMTVYAVYYVGMKVWNAGRFLMGKKTLEIDGYYR